jgi:anti-sigma-K factor RskA
VTASDHERYGDDVGAYLLAALSDIEREAFERHLMGCSACRDELQSLRPAVDALPRSVPQVAPPPTLKSSLMETIERDLDAATERQRRRPRIPAWLGIGRARPAAALTAAAVLLAIGVLAGLGISSLGGGGGARTVQARVDAARVPGASARLWLARDRGAAILRVHGLPTLPRGRVYEVWVRRDGEVTPGSTFEVDRHGAGAAAVPGDLSGARAVLVTREPRGGSPAPTEAPIVSARL